MQTIGARVRTDGGSFRRVGVALCLACLAGATVGAGLGSGAQVRVLQRSPVVVEFETLVATTAASAGKPTVQQMTTFGPGWGGDAQLFWSAPAPVEKPIRQYPYLATLFEVPAAGAYELVLQYTQAPDYGMFTVAVRGRRLVDLDGFSPTVRTERRSLGPQQLDAGANQIVFTVFGKAAAASGYIVGLDRLEARLVPEDTPTPARGNERALTGARAKPDPASPVIPLASEAGPPASRAEAGRALRPVGEEWRPRLEARAWAAARRGYDPRYEARRVRLDWGREDLRVGFRWLDPAGAPGGLWQIYAEMPGAAGDPRPIASGRLPAVAAGEWQDFERDLSQHRPADPLEHIRKLPFGGKFDPGGIQPRLFVRVQPTDEAGAPLGQPTNFVELKFTGEAMGSLKKPAAAVTIALVEFQPVKPYNERFLCWAVATKDGPIWAFTGEPMFKKGQKRDDLCDHESKGFFESFASAMVSAFGSFLDLIGSGIDQVSRFYAEVKSAAVDLAAGPLTALGCDACRYAISLGLDAALASAGVPPSLPDFDAVMSSLQDGSIDAVTDALVATAVSQGLPVDEIPLARDAARAAVEQLVSEAGDAVASRSSAGGGGWGPDLSRAYSPAVLVFEVKNWGQVQSRPMTLQLVGEDPEKVEVPLPTPLLAPPQTLSVGGYAPAWLNVPALQPGTAIRAAVTLTPETDPHLWLDLIYGRSSMLPPQEWCNQSLGADPGEADFARCQSRMWLRGQLMTDAPYDLNRAWGSTYGKGSDRFRVRLFRFGDLGKAEGVEAVLTTESTGSFRMDYPQPTWLGKRLDVCLADGQPCGETVAHAFCKRLGFPIATGAQGEQDLGAANPTIRLGDGAVCRDPGCDGFSIIGCGNTVTAGIVQP